jgi:hypothetical protein
MPCPAQHIVHMLLGQAQPRQNASHTGSSPVDPTLVAVVVASPLEPALVDAPVAVALLEALAVSSATLVVEPWVAVPLALAPVL